jgi:hypothetical protein
VLKRDKVEIDPALRQAIAGNVTEWREPGTRNYIRVGDVVKVAPSAPKKRDGFEARVMAIFDRDGDVTFQLLGGPHGRLMTRFIRAERVTRVAMTRTHPETGIVTERERKRS